MQPEVELGYSEEEFQQAFGFYQQFDVSKAIEDMQAAANALRKVDPCKGKIGSIGFCLGGKLSYLAAAHCQMDVAICYYGVGIEEDLDLQRGASAVLLLCILQNWISLSQKKLARKVSNCLSNSGPVWKFIPIQERIMRLIRQGVTRTTDHLPRWLTLDRLRLFAEPWARTTI